MPETVRTFSTREAAAVTGISTDRLDAFAKRGTMVPSVVNGQGRGVRRRYSFPDLVALYTLSQLRMIGATPEVFRPAIEHLRGLPDLETRPPEGLFIDRDGTVHSGPFPDPTTQRQAWLSEGRYMVAVPIALAVQDLLNHLQEGEDGEATAGLP